MSTSFHESLATLIAKVATRKAMILANPEPTLDAMAQHIAKLMTVLRDVEYALSPDVVFEVAIEEGIKPIDFQGEALVRCDKAQAVISKYRRESR